MLARRDNTGRSLTTNEEIFIVVLKGRRRLPPVQGTRIQGLKKDTYRMLINTKEFYCLQHYIFKLISFDDKMV